MHFVKECILLGCVCIVMACGGPVTEQTAQVPSTNGPCGGFLLRSSVPLWASVPLPGSVRVGGVCPLAAPPLTESKVCKLRQLNLHTEPTQAHNQPKKEMLWQFLTTPMMKNPSPTIEYKTLTRNP